MGLDADKRIRRDSPYEDPLVLEAEFRRIQLRIFPPMKTRVVLAALALGASGTALAQATFTPIPNASGVPGSNQNGCWVSGGTGYSTARLSADGSTVALTIYRGGATSGVVERDFAVWTPSGGTQVIGSPIGQGAASGYGVTGISADGSFVCGTEWIWRRIGGFQSLESTLNPWGFALLFGCNDAGTVVGGFRPSNAAIPYPGDVFRWQLNQGAPQYFPRDAQHPEGYFLFGCISGDGNVVGGATWAPSAQYYQTYAGALLTPSGVTLITPESVGNSTLVNDLSFDGSVAVGQASLRGPLGGFGLVPFRWTAEFDLEVLPIPGSSGAASACDASGDTVVGTCLSFGTAGSSPFLWRSNGGTVDLQSELTNNFGLGAALQGWTLLTASDISADGRVIVGTARNPLGCEQAFVVRFPLPAPASYCTAGTTSSGCNATLGWSGTPRASGAPGSFVLTCGGVEGQRQGLIFYGTQGRTALPWGASSSFLCVRPPTQRSATQSSQGTLGACNGTLTFDPLLFAQANPTALGLPLQAGTTLQFQGWFRDPPSPKSTLLSNALEVVFQP